MSERILMPVPNVPKHTAATPSSRSEDKAKIEALFASIGDGVIATDDSGRITHINQVALHILGYKKKEILYTRFPEKVAAAYDNGIPLKIVDRPIVKAFLTGKSVSQHMNYRKKDGSLVPVQLTVSPIISSKKPIGAIEIFRDVSQEIRDEKLKSDFISIASHQLRTPLSSINIYTRMLEDGLAGELNEKQKSFISTILSSVDRMNELINTLLNVTRIEAGGLTINNETVDAVQLVQQILAEIIPTLDPEIMHLTWELPDKPLLLVTDGLLLKEVFANLLTNAVKYTPAHGRVDLSLSVTDANVTFKVSDSGVGIPLAAHKYIFSKFFRADNILNKDVTGTGLGLYLTKIIVERLGGDIWFDSAENAGTTFYFCLPIGSPVNRRLAKKSPT